MWACIRVVPSDLHRPEEFEVFFESSLGGRVLVDRDVEFTQAHESQSERELDCVGDNGVAGGVRVNVSER